MKGARWLTSSPHQGLPHMRDAGKWLCGPVRRGYRPPHASGHGMPTCLPLEKSG